MTSQAEVDAAIAAIQNWKPGMPVPKPEDHRTLEQTLKDLLALISKSKYLNPSWVPMKTTAELEASPFSEVVNKCPIKNQRLREISRLGCGSPGETWAKGDGTMVTSSQAMVLFFREVAALDKELERPAPPPPPAPSGRARPPFIAESALRPEHGGIRPSLDSLSRELRSP